MLVLEVKNYYTEEDMILLDEEYKFIPLTYDKLFKGIFKERLDILKLFILSQLELDIDPSECKIDLFDSEVVKMNKDEYQKIVDLYVKIGKIYVNIEINREYFRNVAKRNLMYADRLYSMILEQGEDLSELENRIFVQINLNAVDKLDVKKEKLKYGTDKLVVYGINSKEIYNDNKFVLVKYLEYYRDLYYNKREKLEKADLWMVLLTSRTFQELYNVSKKLFNKELHYEFMRKVIDMVIKKEFFEEWEKKKLDELVEYEKFKNAKNDGIEEGFENGREEATNEYILKMLMENLDIDFIVKITGKSEEEIIKIKNGLEKE